MAIVIERDVQVGQDSFTVSVGGEVITTHPTRKGAERLAQRYNETGNLW